MPVAAFATIGSAAKEVLLGGKTEPAFQFDKKVTASVKAADSALSLAPTVVLKGDTADLSLKAAYSKKTYSADALFNSSNKVAVSCSVAELAPGVKVTGSITLPDTASGKLAVDYANQYLNLKATTSLSSAPVIDVVASTAVKGVLLGAEGGFDTAKSAVSKWSVGAGYAFGDAQVAALLSDKGNTLKLLAHQRFDKTKSLAAEVAYDIPAGNATVALGHSRLLASGALFKVKVTNAGIVSSAYEQRLASGEKVAVSAQMNALNLGAPIKYGFAAELN